MPPPTQATLSNRLLRALSPESFALVQPSLEALELPRELPIAEAGQRAGWAYFPESGIVSITKRNGNGRQLEVGLFGRDGMGSTAIVLGADATPLLGYVQMPGHGYRMPAEALQAAMARDAGLHGLLLRYIHVFMMQLSQTALSNGTYTIEERLARWLLMAHDRVDGDVLPLTHEFMAIMLGVRRTGVTLAIHMLEGAHMVRARRGAITVIDREKLEACAADGYGAAEAEFERLIGSLR